MKERPILFSGEMVRAILDGRKTQTRRVVRGQVGALDRGQPTIVGGPACPYGAPGDRLWVKEAAAVLKGNGQRIVYRADGGDPRNGWDDVAPERRPPMVWFSPIYMSRRDSRITLEVTAVRAERLQDITEEDAIAEGVEPVNGHPIRGALIGCGPSYREGFAQVWEDINGKRAPWASSPWVWVVSFRRVAP